MKAFCLFLMVVAPLVTFSQTDPASGDPDTLELSQPAVPGQQSPRLDENQPGYDQVNIKILREEVPLFLQKILRDEKYRGWESGGVYRNEQATKFRVEVRDGMNNQTYYFDKDGSLVGAQ